MRIVLAMALLALGTCWFVPQASAQSFTTNEIERYFGAGVHVPYDGAPYTQRYHFEPPGAFYPGYNAQRLILLDYYDRVIRADKFGYCPPRDPFCDPAAVPSGWRFGSGWRFARRW